MPNGVALNAGKAINGIYASDLFTTCTHTDGKQRGAWWQIDFGAKYIIYKIILYNRVLTSHELNSFKSECKHRCEETALITINSDQILLSIIFR